MIRLPDNAVELLEANEPAVAEACKAAIIAVAAGAPGLLGERLIPLNDAARLFPRPGGRQISKISLWRWARKGVHSPNLPPGVKVRLETIKAGLTRYTSYEAINRFAAALDERDVGLPPTAAAVLRPRRRKELDAQSAAARLKAAGFMERDGQQATGNRQQEEATA
jgi:hypothetical protein